MYCIDLKFDGGMMFWFYLVVGGGLKEVNFWMKNMFILFDIIYICVDCMIVWIVENIVLFLEMLILLGELVDVVLEIMGGCFVEFGIVEGDWVEWVGGGKC